MRRYEKPESTEMSEREEMTLHNMLDANTRRQICSEKLYAKARFNLNSSGRIIQMIYYDKEEMVLEERQCSAFAASSAADIIEIITAELREPRKIIAQHTARPT